jgi:bifunctional non-homologous end joining protein LigD
MRNDRPLSAVALKRASRRRFSPAVPGAKPAPFPGFIEPCDPTLREQAPAGSEWLHGIKIDGYRAQLHIRDGQIRVYCRSGYDYAACQEKSGSLVMVRLRFPRVSN